MADECGSRKELNQGINEGEETEPGKQVLGFLVLLAARVSSIHCLSAKEVWICSEKIRYLFHKATAESV